MKTSIVVILSVCLFSCTYGQVEINVISLSEFQNVKINGVSMLEMKNTMGDPKKIRTLFGKPIKESIIEYDEPDKPRDFSASYDFDGFQLGFSDNMQADQSVQYLEYPELKKFEGTWISINSDNDFRLILRSTKDYFDSGDGVFKFYYDKINGDYELNGKLYENTISIGEFKNDSTKNKISFRFYDQDYKKSASGTLEMLPDNTLKLHLVEHGGVILDNEVHHKGLSVPKRAIFKKIK